MSRLPQLLATSLALVIFLTTGCNDNHSSDESQVEQTISEEKTLIPPSEEPLVVTQITDEETAKLEKAQKDIAAIDAALGEERNEFAAVGIGVGSFTAGALLAATKASTISSGLKRISNLFENTEWLRNFSQHMEDQRTILEAKNAEYLALRQEFLSLNEQANLAEAALPAKVGNTATAQEIAAEEARDLARAAQESMIRAENALRPVAEEIMVKSLFNLHAWARGLKSGIARIAGSKIVIRGIQTIGVLASGAIFIENYDHVIRIDKLNNERTELIKLIDSKTKKVIQEEAITTAASGETPKTEVTPAVVKSEEIPAL